MIGLHVSIAGSIDLAFDRAKDVGATTFQIFTRNPNQWKFKPIPEDTAALFREKRKASGFQKVVDHMPYLPNLASPLKSTMKISRYSLAEEVKRCDELGVEYLVVHLGSHLGKGSAEGMANVAGACKESLDGSTGDTMILLENMAGQKNCVGARFEELRGILDRVGDEKRMGVCLDSCHLYAAGFDLTSEEAVERTMGLFDELVGYERLKVLHLNDSKGAIGSKLDRHESVGEGKIGRKGMKAILHHPGMLERPVILETPYEDQDEMKESMRTVRSLLK